MKRNKLAKIVALATLVSASEATMNRGAVDVSISNYDKLLNVINSEAPSINAQKFIRDSIYSILDTMRIDNNSIINTDLLRSYILMHSQDSIGPLYSSIDELLDSTKLNSKVITKDFIKSYIRMRVEEKSLYDKKQLLSKSIIDTIPLNLKYIDRTTFDALAYIESKYNPRAYNKHSGASGVFQFMAPTYKDNGEGDFDANIFKADKNIDAGRNYVNYLETNLPKLYDKLYAYNPGRKWDKLSSEEQVALIVMAFNAGPGYINDKQFNVKRMPQESIKHVDKLNDAKLIVSLDHLVNFKALIFSDTTTMHDFAPIKPANSEPSNLSNLSDTTKNPLDALVLSNSYSASVIVAQRIHNITLLLESTESYLSKNFPYWNKMDVKTQQELVVAASTYGPSMFMDKVKENRKNKDWNFRQASPDVLARLNDFNDKQFFEHMRYAWDYSKRDTKTDNIKEDDIKNVSKKNSIKKDNVKIYHPQQRIVYGTKQLMDLEKQLAQTRTLDWSSYSEDKRRELLTAAAISGYNNFKQDNFNPIKLSKADQAKLNTIKYAFEKYSKVSEYRAMLINHNYNAQ